MCNTHHSHSTNIASRKSYLNSSHFYCLGTVTETLYCRHAEGQEEASAIEWDNADLYPLVVREGKSYRDAFALEQVRVTPQSVTDT